MATPLAGIPELSESQQSKYLTHNQAIRHLEALGIGSVESVVTAEPDTTNLADGVLYAIDTGATGTFANYINHIAQYQSNSWAFYSTFTGFAIFDKAQSAYIYWDGATWKPIGSGTLAFSSSNAIALPYTLKPADLTKELVLDNATGVVNIPDSATGFQAGWQCMITLDGSGDVSILREDGSQTDLLFSAGNTQLKTQGTIAIVHRGNNVWLIRGYLE